jgi:hypothetical protein
MVRTVALLVITAFSFSSAAELPDWFSASYFVSDCSDNLSLSLKTAKERFDRSQGLPRGMLELDPLLENSTAFLSKFNWESARTFTFWTGRMRSRDPSNYTRVSLQIRDHGYGIFIKISLTMKRPSDIVGTFNSNDFFAAATDSIFKGRDLEKTMVNVQRVKDDTVFTLDIDKLPLAEQTMVNIQNLLTRLNFI